MRLLVCTTVWVSCIGGQANAQHAEIRQMLDDAWQLSSQARELADEIFSTSPHLHQDPKFLYAYVLTLIRQSRMDEALQQSRSLLRLQPDDLQAHWTEFWLLLSRRNFSTALQRIDRLARLIQQQLNADHTPEQVIEEALRATASAGDLGRALGFLAAPAAEAVNQTELERTRQQAGMRLDADLQVAVDLGQRAVLDDFARRQDELAALSQERREVDEAQRAAALDERQQERTQLDGQRRQLDESQRRIEATFREDQAALQQQQAALAADASNLSADVNWRRTDWLRIGGEIAWIDRQLLIENDPLRRSLLITQMNDLIRMQNLQLADLRAAEAALVDVQGQLAQVQAAARQAQRRFDQEVAVADRERKQLDRRRRQLQRQTADLTNPSQREPAQIRTMQRTATNLTTYLPFPLERERERLLGQLTE